MSRQRSKKARLRRLRIDSAGADLQRQCPQTSQPNAGKLLTSRRVSAPSYSLLLHAVYHLDWAGLLQTLVETASGLLDLLGPAPGTRGRDTLTPSATQRPVVAAAAWRADGEGSASRVPGFTPPHVEHEPPLHFLDLPDELQALIFELADGNTKHTLPLVSRHFRDVCLEHTGLLWPSLEMVCTTVIQAPDGHLKYGQPTPEGLAPKIRWVQRRLSGLRQLSLVRDDAHNQSRTKQQEIAQKALPLLDPLLDVLQTGSITSLQFGHFTVPTGLLVSVGSLTTLQELSVNVWTSELEGMVPIIDSRLGCLTRLTSLHLECCHRGPTFSAADFTSLRTGCTQLRKVALGGNMSLGTDPSWLLCFPHLTTLSLHLRDNSLIGHPCLEQLTTLQFLDMTIHSDTASAFAGLAPKACATSPTAQHQHDVLARIAGRISLYTLSRPGQMAALGALAGLTRLEQLYLGHIKDLTSIPAAIAALNLKTLAISHCPVTTLPPPTAVMWQTLTRLRLSPCHGTTTAPLVDAVRERAVALEHLMVPQSDALVGLWTSAVATQLPKLRWLTLGSKVKYGGAPGEGHHRLVHVRELAALIKCLAERRPALELCFDAANA